MTAFPSSDFAQESGAREQIADLGFGSYRVKFPMYARTTVVGPQAHPLFAALAAFASNVKPTDAAWVAAVEKAPAAR